MSEYPFITVLDTETCGLEGGIVEIAGVSLMDGAYHQSLVRPDRPIEIEAMAVHHITEVMVADAPTIEQILDTSLQPGADIYTDADILAAHNAPFDSAMMPEDYRATNLIGGPAHRADGSRIGQVQWICTYRCALHLWPDSPRHGNQYLRYMLGVDVSDMPPEAGGMAHRALYDAWCTSKILEMMLETRTPEELVLLSGTPVLHTTMAFGKHRGKTWEQVSRIDRGYLRWILDTEKSGFTDVDDLHTARHWYDAR